IETQGVVVRTASELARALRRNAIACTARMKDAIGGHATTVAMTGVDFGRDTPGGACFEIIEGNKVTSRWHFRRARGLTAWTGRKTDLQFLGKACQRARSSTGQCIGIIGEAGIGKSRLIHEFLTSEATSGCRIVESGALESDTISSFHTVKRLLRAIIQLEEGNEPQGVVEKVAAYVERLGANASIKSPLLFVLNIPTGDREWESLTASERARRVRNAIMVVLVLIARIEPLIVLIEDLHWADAESNAVLDRLIDGIATQRILLLTTFRP